MATTARRWEVLVSGFRDTTGAVVASGKVRWYNPGTLVAATAYSDAACTNPETAPLTLSAGGTGTLYFLEPVRVIVKDSTESVTYFDDIPALNRHDSVYVTSTGWNGGVETTLETILSSLYTNLGADGRWLESAGATAIAYSTVLGQLMVPVTAFGAVGDGITDDTAAIQAASDRVEARGGGWVYFPKGTYRVNSAITIDTAGVSWFGAGRGIAVIKNFGTTSNALTVNVSGTDSKVVLRDFSITANTTSSGAGISFTAGDRAVIERVQVDLHRGGVDTRSVNDPVLRDIVIGSTDDNAAGVGIGVGVRGRLAGAKVNCGTGNGSAVVMSETYARAEQVFTSGWATGMALSGIAVQAIGCHVSGATTAYALSGADSMAKDSNAISSTTGYSMTGARSGAQGCFSTATTGFSLGAASTFAVSCNAASGTTGFSVGAFANCQVVGNRSSCTTDLSVNASATLLMEHTNGFAVVSDSATTPHSWLKDRAKVEDISTVTHSTATPTITPTPGTCDVYVASLTNAGVVSACTLAATATTGLVDGQLMTLVIQRTAGTGTPTITVDAQYQSLWTIAVPAAGNMHYLPMRWRSAISRWVPAVTALGGTGGFTAIWT